MSRYEMMTQNHMRGDPVLRSLQRRFGVYDHQRKEFALHTDDPQRASDFTRDLNRKESVRRSGRI
jgi:hypothetical protein